MSCTWPSVPVFTSLTIKTSSSAHVIPDDSGWMVFRHLFTLSISVHISPDGNLVCFHLSAAAYHTPWMCRYLFISIPFFEHHLVFATVRCCQWVLLGAWSSQFQQQHVRVHVSFSKASAVPWAWSPHRRPEEGSSLLEQELRWLWSMVWVLRI